MKFTCGNCSTGYSVPDEKVRGKRVRITCRKCGAPIIVEGRTTSIPPTSQPAPAPQDVKPVRSMMKTQLGLQAPVLPGAGGPRVDRAPVAAPPAPAKARIPSAETRLEDAAARKQGPKSVAPRLPTPSTLREEDDRWSVAVSRRDPRKMTTEQVTEALASGLINDHTLIWKRGMDAWKPLAWVPAFADIAGKRPAESDLEPPPSTSRGAAVPSFKPAEQAQPQEGDQGGLDFDDEPTAVIDAAKAHALLSAKEAKPPVQPTPHGSSQTTASAHEDDDDEIARVATSEAAQELLRDAPDSRPPPPPPAEPSVVVSPEAEKPERVAPPPAKVPSTPAPAAAEPKRSSYHPSLPHSMQNEATRIVRVKKSGRNSMIIGLLIVAFASAAGGFLASRFLAPHAPVGAPPSAW